MTSLFGAIGAGEGEDSPFGSVKPAVLPPSEKRAGKWSDPKKVAANRKAQADGSASELNVSPKRAKGLDTNKYSLRDLREKGVTFQRVEFHNAYTGKKTDLWGFGDVIFFDEHSVTILQVTSYGNISGHVSKIVKDPVILKAAKDWLACPDRRIEIWGYHKPATRVERVVFYVTMDVLLAKERGERMSYK